MKVKYQVTGMILVPYQSGRRCRTHCLHYECDKIDIFVGFFLHFAPFVLQRGGTSLAFLPHLYPRRIMQPIWPRPRPLHPPTHKISLTRSGKIPSIKHELAAATPVEFIALSIVASRDRRCSTNTRTMRLSRPSSTKISFLRCLHFSRASGYVLD